jgi:hypothetical protein
MRCCCCGALRAFRSGKRPECAPRGRPAHSACPLFAGCPRWSQPDDYRAALDETAETTERRRASWPCSRLMDLLGADTTTIR